jgi:DNA/RNA-binding domain of Phe-tRNA-synthetase-like protein
MTPAAVAPAVLERHPGYAAVVVLADGVINRPTDAASDALLREAEAFAANLEEPVARHPHLAAWRAAFAANGIKAKRHPCSAEALVRRARSPEGLPRINALVDLYNAISVLRVVPIGGEDRDALRGTNTLRLATGDEPCDVRGGAGEPEPALPGEPVWADDAGVTCRRWSWRQGERTRLTEATTRAVFLLERLEPMALDALDHAAADLCDRLRDGWPGARVESFPVPESE